MLVNFLPAAVLFLTSCLGENDDQAKSPSTPNETGTVPTDSDTGASATVDTAGGDTGDVYVQPAPQKKGSFQINGSLLSVFPFSRSLAYLSQFDGTNDGLGHITQPRYELGLCDNVIDESGVVNSTPNCHVLATLDASTPFDPEQASVEMSSKTLDINGQKVLAVPYHSSPKTSTAGDADVGQATTSYQGVLLYHESGTLIQNIKLDGLTLNGYPLTGAQDILYLEGTGELVIACNNYASQPDTGDPQIVTNDYGTSYPPSALVYVADPLTSPSPLVMPLVTASGEAFYGVSQIEQSGDRLLATAILGEDGSDSQVVSINPLSTALVDENDYEVLASLISGSGYVTTLSEDGDLLVSGEAKSDDAMVLSRLDSTANLEEVTMPIGWTYMTGALQYGSGLFATGQEETVAGTTSVVSLYWLNEGIWNPVNTASGLFGLPPVSLKNDSGDSVLVASIAKTERQADGSWKSDVSLYQ